MTTVNTPNKKLYFNENYDLHLSGLHIAAGTEADMLSSKDVPATEHGPNTNETMIEVRLPPGYRSNTPNGDGKIWVRASLLTDKDPLPF